MGAFDFTDSTADDEEDDRPARRGGGGSRLSDKSKIVYVILALVFGGLGIHNFYAGRFLVGAMQLMILVGSIAMIFCGGIGLATVWIPSVWAIIDIITVTRDGQGRKFS